ncbi:MAG: peroxiredoxin family protein [Burkholderiales bacterium]
MRPFVVLAALALAAAAGAAELRPWTGGATPPLVLQDLNGRTHRLADYRGKVVLVNFWATWCEPCREEMPSIERLRQSLAGQPFEVLAVNIGEPLGRIERFLEKMPLGFPMLLDRDTGVAKAWKARVVPATFLVGPDGRIRYVHYGELDWSSEPVRKRVAELLE